MEYEQDNEEKENPGKPKWFEMNLHFQPDGTVNGDYTDYTGSKKEIKEKNSDNIVDEINKKLEELTNGVKLPIKINIPLTLVPNIITDILSHFPKAIFPLVKPDSENTTETSEQLDYLNNSILRVMKKKVPLSEEDKNDLEKITDTKTKKIMEELIIDRNFVTKTESGKKNICEAFNAHPKWTKEDKRYEKWDEKQEQYKSDKS